MSKALFEKIAAQFPKRQDPIYQPEWSRLTTQLFEGLTSIYEKNSWFELDGCNVYIRSGISYALQVPVIRITSVESKNPKTGQFRNMITGLEDLARSLGYYSLSFESIVNPDFLQMLGRNGYNTQSNDMYMGTATKVFLVGYEVIDYLGIIGSDLNEDEKIAIDHLYQRVRDMTAKHKAS